MEEEEFWNSSKRMRITPKKGSSKFIAAPVAGESCVHYYCSFYYSYCPLLTWGGCLTARAGQAASELRGATLSPWPCSLSGSFLAAWGVKKNLPQNPTAVSTGVSTSAGERCPQVPREACAEGNVLRTDTCSVGGGVEPIAGLRSATVTHPRGLPVVMTEQRWVCP